MSRPAATTAGVLLAAGRGRRMGRLKQVLPWGGATVIEAAYDALAPYCDGGMVIVVGDGAAAIARALGPRPFHAVESDSRSEQVRSARAGLRRALEIPGVERVLLHLADHPVVPPGVIETLLGRADECDRVLIPTCDGRGGHPVLVPAAVAARLVAATPRELAGGLRGYWQRHADQVRRVEFPGAAGLLRDLDTPEQYDAARPRDPRR